MPTLVTLPWSWTRQPRPAEAVIFTSRFDAVGLRARWQLLVGGLRLRRAVLDSPGALGFSLRVHPLRGHFHTLSMWTDEQSLLAFAHGSAHRAVVRRIAQVSPVRGVLVSRPVDPRQRPTWRSTLRWVTGAQPGPYVPLAHGQAGDRTAAAKPVGGGS